MKGVCDILGSYTNRSFDLKYKNIILDRAEGSYFYSTNNNPIIDFCSTILMSNFGHKVERIEHNICQQLRKLDSSSSFLLQNSTSLKLAKKLHEFTDYDFSKFFFASSGTDAVETALKILLCYKKESCEQKTIITLNGCYHGSSLALKLFEDQNEGSIISNESKVIFKSIEVFEDDIAITINEMKEICKNSNVVGILTEIIQLSNYCKVLPSEFFIAIDELRKQEGFIWINDEISTGMGRCGLPFAYKDFNIVPDMITIGKAFGGGYSSFSGVCMNDKIYNSIKSEVFNHGYTTSSHPIACCAAIGSIDYYKENIYEEELKEKSSLIVMYLQRLKDETQLVENFYGKGFMFAVKFSVDNANSKGIPNMGFYISSVLLKKGVLVYSGGDDKITIAPPLVITCEEIRNTFEKILKVVKLVDKFIGLSE